MFVSVGWVGFLLILKALSVLIIRWTWVEWNWQCECWPQGTGPPSQPPLSTSLLIPAQPLRPSAGQWTPALGALNSSALPGTLSQQGRMMLQAYPCSAGLYNTAWTLSVSSVVRCCMDTLGHQGCTMLHGHSVSRVVQYCLDTLSQQGCTILHGHSQSAGLYNTAWTLSVSRVVQYCMDTLSQQGCTILLGHSQSAGLYSTAWTLSVSRVVQYYMDTLSQQGCTILHGHSQSAALYDAAWTPLVSRVVQCCRDTLSAAGYTSSQCCTQHPQ